MAIVDALNKVTGGHGSTIEEAVKNLSSGGGSGGIMIVNSNYDASLDSNILDKTWQEIYDAITSGVAVLIYNNTPDLGAVTMTPVVLVSSNEGMYQINTIIYNGLEVTTMTLTANTANDYPKS